MMNLDVCPTTHDFVNCLAQYIDKFVPQAAPSKFDESWFEIHSRISHSVNSLSPMRMEQSMFAKGISQHGLKTSLKNSAFAMILILFVHQCYHGTNRWRWGSPTVNQLTSISLNYFLSNKFKISPTEQASRR